MNIVFLGLSLSSSWGNGHATTYRALLKGLHLLGHEVLFLERDVPWYAAHRDLETPDFCRLAFYADVDELHTRWENAIRDADAVILGSYVPDGAEIGRWVQGVARAITAFYDIDTPVTLADLCRGDNEYLARDVVRGFDVYLSFTGGPTLDRLEQEFGARRASALYCAVDETRYQPTGTAIEWDVGYLGTYSEDRQPSLERLLNEPARRMPERRFVVAGSKYPETTVWPDNVTRIDHLPPDRHADFYSRLRFALNITRRDMIEAGWSPSVRIFEAAACGTPIISDDWPGLRELLPEGEAILIAHDAETMCDLLTNLSDKRRRDIATTAERIVLARHTGRARAAELVNILTRMPKPDLTDAMAR